MCSNNNKNNMEVIVESLDNITEEQLAIYNQLNELNKDYLGIDICKWLQFITQELKRQIENDERLNTLLKKEEK